MTPAVAFATTLVGEIVHMGFVLLPLAARRRRPRSCGIIAVPDGPREPRRRRAVHDGAPRATARSRPGRRRVLGARRSRSRSGRSGSLREGFGAEVARELAAIIQEETGVGAVAITDRRARPRLGGHRRRPPLPGDPIVSPFTRQAIAERDGDVRGRRAADRTTARSRRTARSTRSSSCRSQVDEQVIGTVQLFEPRGRACST